MAYSVANGTLIDLATGFDSPISVTAASNAVSAVLTATNTLAVNDIVEWTSGWAEVSGRLFKVTAATGTSVTLGGIDTTATVDYPSGAGVGTIRKATGYTDISQVLDFKSTGGEPKTKNFQFLADTHEREILLGESAARLTFMVADDMTMAGQLALSAANKDRVPRALKLRLSNGGVIHYQVLVFFKQTPNLASDEITSTDVVLFIQTSPTRY